MKGDVVETTIRLYTAEPLTEEDRDRLREHIEHHFGHPKFGEEKMVDADDYGVTELLPDEGVSSGT